MITSPHVPLEAPTLPWENGCAVELRDVVRRHSRFPTAKWALPEAHVAMLSSLSDKFVPADPLKIIAPLFNEDGWEDGDESESYEEKIARRERERRVAVRRIWKAGGLDLILGLVKQ